MADQIKALNQKEFPVLSDEAKEKMKAEIEQASAHLDSVGGILQTIVTGFPAGIGEPFFDSIESTISHLMFSIPAVKGVSFGEGFGFANLYGSQANDPIITKDQQIQTLTNHNGGINGGISNGMPIVFQTCIKPTPSIYQKQHSVDYQSKEEVILEIKGRHDPAIIHRARAVVDALCAFGLLDLWMSQQATRSFEA
ncbi:chorismate synthase [gut metagenome]|uniref:chorismate synthase n=1 Tax=gut metagenome TaxID=749906 RepID=J9G443_9ZZZZ